jgi:hypothetical protein
MTEYLPDHDPDPGDHDPPISVMRTEEIAPSRRPCRITLTASALNSGVNDRRFRFPMTLSYCTFVRFGVSTKPGKLNLIARTLEPTGRDRRRWVKLGEKGKVDENQSGSVD